MLSCNDLRERMPAIEAGEPASGAERDHLAACEACRAEAARVRDDLARVRRDLASLAPSPFLEDAVRDIAAAGQPEPTPRLSRTTRWAAVGAAAAAVLVAVLVAVTRPTAPPEPTVTIATGEGDEKGPPEGHTIGPVSTVAWPPTPREALVAGAPGPRPQPGRPYTLAKKPSPGYAILGRELLARIAVRGAPSDSLAARIERAWARLTRDGKRRTTTVSIENPETKARTWVHAVVDRDYAGTLLLEEPLARAIGFHAGATRERVQHEIVEPGTNKVWARTWSASARIALIGTTGGGDPTLDVTERIQVREPGDPHAARPWWHAPPNETPRVVATGVAADMGFVGKELAMHWLHGRWFVAPDRNVPWRAGTTEVGTIPLALGEVTRAALEFRASLRDPLCYLILPPLDVGGDAPVRTPRVYGMKLERIRVEGPFTPGAQLTIARAWRAHEAIPTRTGVAFTTAADDGHASFVVVRGEAGPLRIRERRADGSVRWHLAEVRRGYQSTDEHQVIVARGSGVLTTDGGVFDLERGRMMTSSPMFHAATRTELAAALRAHLAKPADAAGRRSPGGPSKLRLTIVGMPAAAWSDAVFVLQACSSPEVKIDRVAFATGSPQRTGTIRPQDIDAVPYELPKDSGLVAVDPRKPPGSTIKLVVGSFGAPDWWRAYLMVPSQGRGGQTQGASTDTLDSALRSMIQRAGGANAELTIKIVAQPKATFARFQTALAHVRKHAPDAKLLLMAMEGKGR